MTKGGPFLLATPWSYRAGKRQQLSQSLRRAAGSAPACADWRAAGRPTPLAAGPVGWRRWGPFAAAWPGNG